MKRVIAVRYVGPEKGRIMIGGRKVMPADLVIDFESDRPLLPDPSAFAIVASSGTVAHLVTRGDCEGIEINLHDQSAPAEPVPTSFTGNEEVTREHATGDLPVVVKE